jgi:hypothetical protein
VEAINEFGAPNIKYIEPWKLNGNGEDKFSSYGPGPNGRMVQIRTADGEHFTTVGELMVAQYVLPKIVDSLAEIGERICESATEGRAP